MIPVDLVTVPFSFNVILEKKWFLPSKNNLDIFNPISRNNYPPPPL